MTFLYCKIVSCLVILPSKSCLTWSPSTNLKKIRKKQNEQNELTTHVPKHNTYLHPDLLESLSDKISIDRTSIKMANSCTRVQVRVTIVLVEPTQRCWLESTHCFLSVCLMFAFRWQGPLVQYERTVFLWQVSQLSERWTLCIANISRDLSEKKTNAGSRQAIIPAIRQHARKAARGVDSDACYSPCWCKMKNEWRHNCQRDNGKLQGTAKRT